MPKFYLTFDTEEFTAPESYRVKSEYNNATGFTSKGCIKIVRLLAKYNIKATFFITGYFAEKEREIVKLLVENGHEIACHSYSNHRLANLSMELAEEQITLATKILVDITSLSVKGFRGPECYISDKIIEVLDKLGYQYDCSLHPAIVPGRYYNWLKPLDPYFWEGENILEIPISVIPYARMPISWWWMRNVGLWLTCLGSNINLSRNRDVVLYFHPWEFVEIPFIKGVPGHFTRKCGEANLLKIEKFISYYNKGYKFDCLSNLANRILCLH